MKRLYGAAVPVGAALLMLSPQAASAGDTQNLGKMVVSANRVETAADHVGSAVTVITAEDLEKKQAATLEDALKDIPGLYVYSNGNSAYNTRFKVRGYDSGRVLVLIDGVKIDNQASQMYDRPLNHLQASDIERIEVLRGSQGTLYGTDAIGGVISITTKSGKNARKLLEGVATTEIGTDVTQRGSLSAWGRYENVYYKVGGAGFATHGDDNRRSVQPDESDGSRNVNYDAKVGADLLQDAGFLDLLNLEGSYSFVRGTAEYDTSSGNTDSDGFMLQKTETGRVQMQANMFDGLLDNTFSASRMDAYVHVRTNRSATTTPSRYWGDLQRYEYQGVLRHMEGHSIVFGADQERDHYRSRTSTASANRALVNSSFFGDYALNLLDDALTLTAGARQYYHDTFGDHTTYRTTASYRLAETGTRFHASYSTGFKAPTLVQIYYNRDAANSSLQPEESQGYDVGVEQTLLEDRVHFDVTFFNNRMTNQIEARGTGGNRYYANVQSARHMGVESSAGIEATDEVSLTLTHTYMQSRNNATDMAMDYQPHHVASLRAAYAPHAVPGLSTWTRATVATGSFDTSEPTASAPRHRVGGYTTWDVGADYKIDDAFTVYGRVENLFDKTYGQYYNCNNAGISGYAGLRMKF